jgi:hypothetical protein
MSILHVSVPCTCCIPCLHASCPCCVDPQSPCCMSLLLIHATYIVCTCLYAACLLLHAHATYPCCLPTLHFHAAWLCFKFILQVLLHVHAECPYLCVHTFCPCCLSMLHFRCMPMLHVKFTCQNKFTHVLRDWRKARISTIFLFVRLAKRESCHKIFLTSLAKILVLKASLALRENVDKRISCLL